MTSLPALSPETPPSTVRLLRRPPPSAVAPIVLTPLVFLVHGYHPFAGDAGIYAAGIRHVLDPSLYPLNAVFVAAFTRFSIFAWFVAGTVRLLHLPLGWVLLAAQLGSIGLWLHASVQLSRRVFLTEQARWGSALQAAACFTLPVAGTALFLMDPYVTPRSFSAPVALLAVCGCLDRAWLRTVLLLGLAVAIHPLMGAYAVTFVLLCALAQEGRMRAAWGLCGAGVVLAGTLFVLSGAQPVDPAYREAVSLAPRNFLFLARWHWFEIAGLVLPLILLVAGALYAGSARQRTLCLACVLQGSTATLVAAAFVHPGGPYALVPLQVLRSFHLIYATGVVLCGGLLARLWLRSRLLTGSLILLLFAGMLAAQCLSWTGSQHIEWPGGRRSNPWQQAFLWIRSNTPRNAVFAFNPKLVYLPEEDEQGFRAIAERDQLADDKDAGVAAVLPRLAPLWAAQRNAELDVDRMSDAQRRAVLTPFRVNWVLLAPQSKTGLPCPWRNRVIAVCRLR